MPPMRVLTRCRLDSARRPPVFTPLHHNQRRRNPRDRAAARASDRCAPVGYCASPGAAPVNAGRWGTRDVIRAAGGTGPRHTNARDDRQTHAAAGGPRIRETDVIRRSWLTAVRMDRILCVEKNRRRGHSGSKKIDAERHRSRKDDGGRRSPCCPPFGRSDGKSDRAARGKVGRMPWRLTRLPAGRGPNASTPIRLRPDGGDVDRRPGPVRVEAADRLVPATARPTTCARRGSERDGGGR